MPGVSAHNSMLNGVRVLLVEDHPVVREVISLLLVEFGAVVTATGGVAEALRAFEQEPSDVVLSGIEMPGEDGYALIRKLRALPRDRGGRTPIAALTGLSAFEDRVRVLRAGFECYVSKPVDARVLVNVVASLAAKNRAAQKSPERTPAVLGAR